MDIFVDTADLEEIKEAESWGILDGVTTNPSLIKKAASGSDITLEKHIKEILRTVDGPVSLEVCGSCFDDMIEEAKTIYDKFNSINDNVVIKIPVNTAMEKGKDDFEGIRATKELSDQGIPVNSTLIMSPNQALMAAKAGATYVSPFLGRIDDYIRHKMGIERGEDYPKGTFYPENLADRIRDKKLNEGISRKDKGEIIYEDEETMKNYDWAHDKGITSGTDMVWSIRNILLNYNLDTKIIAASIRTARQVRICAEIGAEIATIPFDVINDMMVHYKTSEGMKSFTDDVIPEYEDIVKG